MAEPRVSVCIACYNRQDYISETIESVLAQTYPDFELIITDNCSTDRTVEIVKQYAAKDSRVRLYINDKNLGAISNFNRGLFYCRGEYVKFLCSDDLLCPRCLEVFVDVMTKNPDVSLVTSFTKAFVGDESVRDEKFFPSIGLINGNEAQKSLFFQGNWPGSPSSTMFRRKDLYIGLFNLMWKYWLGDLDMWIRLLGIGDAYVVPEILSKLRIHNKSESAMHSVDFRLTKERLQLASIAFEFPHIYGNLTKREKINICYHLLKRLVREGYDQKGVSPKIDMLKIGFSYSRIIFPLLLLKNLHRLFRRDKRSN